MSGLLAPLTSRLPALPAGAVVPSIVAVHGKQAAWRYLEFFAVSIRNPNTRAAYARAASGFFAWCDGLGLALPGIQPVHVAAWIEQLGRGRAVGADGEATPGGGAHAI